MCQGIVKGGTREVYLDARQAQRRFRKLFWKSAICTVLRQTPVACSLNFVAVSNTAPVLRAIIDNYLRRPGVKITPAHESDHLSMGMSLIASTGGAGRFPAYARKSLPPSITSRPLKSAAPTVDLVVGYRKANQPPFPMLLLSRLGELVTGVSNKTR